MFFSLNQKIKKEILWLLIFIITIFILFHVKDFIFREKISLYDFEKQNKIVTNNEYYNLRGNGIHIKKITINKREYFMNENNEFDIKLYLFPGMNIFYLSALTESEDILKRKIFIFNKRKKSY